MAFAFDCQDRSEGEDQEDDEEAEECSEYSDEEDEAEEDEDNEEEIDDAGGHGGDGDARNEEERLENVENQKISSEKMSNSLHRLHVEFDDLSVVDEEEELKKDKPRKEACVLEEKENIKNVNDPGVISMDPRNGYQCFTARYGSSGTTGSDHTYYPECPFVFPNPGDSGFQEIIPIDPSTMLLTPCPRGYDGSITSMPNFEAPRVVPVMPRYDDNQMTYDTPVGWQSNLYAPAAAFQNPDSFQGGAITAQSLGMSPASMYTISEQSNSSAATPSTVRATSIPRGTLSDEPGPSGRLITPIESNVTNVPSLLQRRNVLLNQPSSFYRETIIPKRVVRTEASNSAEALTRNGWDFGSPESIAENREMFHDTVDNKNGNEARRNGEDEEIAKEREGSQRFEDSTGTVVGGGSERPKHFFAPLPAKIQHCRQDSSDKTAMRTTTNPSDSPSMTFFENFGTGRSSSSDRTNSTIMSAKHLRYFSDLGAKGIADICVNGATAGYGNDKRDSSTNEQRYFKSSENLLIGNDNSRGNSLSRQGSNNPLVKSISCQDLSSEPQQNFIFDIARAFNGDTKSQKFAKSDNTLDNPVSESSKPFRSQLNVTLKYPGNGNRRLHGLDSPETPEIPKLPTIDYRLFSNPFLKTFDSSGASYGDCGVRSPVTRPLSIQVSENVLGKTIQPAIDYSSPMLTHSYARRLNPDENPLKSTRTYSTEVESDRHRVLLPSTSQPIDSRIISSPKHRQEFQVTSFEQPNPRSLHPGLTAFDIESLRRIPATPLSNPIIQNRQKLYQNVPFVPSGAAMFCSPGQSAMRMFYENQTQKVPAQTQTSIDGGSNHEDELGDVSVKTSKSIDPESPSNLNSPTLRRKRTVRKDKRPLSPAAQRRRLRKQSSIDIPDAGTPNKISNKSRKFSPATTTTTTTSEHLEDKNESRSSSSGQDSPRKDQSRRVSVYFNSKKRPSLASVKTARSTSIDNTKDGFVSRGEALDTTNSERERTNSISSREAASGKARKSSVSSGKVPWCACWGNGCI